MVSYIHDNHVEHTNFRKLPDYLEAGDVVVINTSGTRNAALQAKRADGIELELHLSTHLPADLWTVEARQPGYKGTLPFYDIQPGEHLQLPGAPPPPLVHHTP